MKKIICCIGFSSLSAWSSASSQVLVASSPEIGTASAPSPSQAAPLAARSAPEPLFEALKARDADRVEKLLAADPSLASARRADGVSAVLLALSARNGEFFLRPQTNPLLRAVLAHHPQLDAFDAAAVGDVKRVAAEIERDPGFVRALHAPPIAWTALQFAAFGGQLETAKLLLERGADVKAIAQTKFRNTPLQIALLTGQLEVAQLLIAKGADVNAKQAEGFTALHAAAELGSEPLIRLLLDAGADINAKAEDGRRPLDVALSDTRSEAAELLRQMGAKPGKE
jgi:ankyrin repeat protein